MVAGGRETTTHRLGPRDAAVALGVRHGVRSVEPAILKDGSNLLVHLRPAPVVIRVATFTALVRGNPLPFLEREVRLATALVEAGAAVAPPSAELPPGPHLVDGWAMTAWAYVEHDPDGIPEPLTALAALDDLHAAMRRIRIDLPLLGPATSDLDLAIASAVRFGLVGAAEAATMQAERDRLLERLLALAPDRQPLHGDAFPRNSLVTPNGVVWIDLEDGCSGPAAWDQGVLLRRTEDPAVEAILRDRDGSDALDTAIALRVIQADVWTILHDARVAGRIPIPTSFG